MSLSNIPTLYSYFQALLSLGIILNGILIKKKRCIEKNSVTKARYNAPAVLSPTTDDLLYTHGTNSCEDI